MSNAADPTPLHALTLETLCDELVSGRLVSLGGEIENFSLDSREARAILDWYRHNPGKWSKSVYKEDVEAIVDQLSLEPPILPTTARTDVARERRTLHLKSLRAHRFAGIHRYGEPDHAPPEFFLELRKPLTLIEGGNGAGKTSLVNAIMWCLTGYVSRSQRPPELTNHPVPITTTADDLPLAAGSGARVISPITPLPSADVLGRLGDGPLALDTWVELAFVDEQGKEAGTVRRAVRRGARDSVTFTTPDFSELGLDPLMREVGTRMPGLIPYIELGTSSALGKAVAELIGLKPLEDLAQHATKSRGKLTKDLVREREAEIRTHDGHFLKLRQELSDLIADHPAIAPGRDLPTPDAEDVDEALANLARHFEDLQAQTLSGAREVLGEAFADQDRSAREDLLRNVGPALGQLEPGQLSRLDSASRLASLGKLPEADLSAAEALIRRLCEEADEVAEVHRRPDLATRLRLYARVAGWIKDHSPPPHAIEGCPLCREVLEGKVDGVTGKAVTAHLREFLAAEADFLEKTALAWEQASLARLARDLPESLRREMGRPLPARPADLISAALGHELFQSQCFRGSLAALKPPTFALCERVSATLPPFVEPTVPTLPSCFGVATRALPDAIRQVMRAIAFARWRRRNDAACKEAYSMIIGPAGVQSGERPPARDGTAGHQPLADRLAILDRLVRNASPLGQALTAIGAMREVRARSSEKRERLALYARAAKALEELLRLPSLVEGQVTFLTRTLGEATDRWKSKLYAPAFVGAPGATSPSVQADGTVSVAAEAGGVRAPAQHVANTGELRATLFAFLLAFWEYLLETRGGLALLLLDDPQEMLDPNNRRRMANSISTLARGKIRVIATTLDGSFRKRVVAAMVREWGRDSFDHFRIHPPRASRPSIALGPFAESVEMKRRAFGDPANENDALVARDYLNEVRIYLELRLGDLFDTPEQGLPRQPTLADLVDAIRSRNRSGCEPFAGRAFLNLASYPALMPGSRLLTMLNDCHHANADQITYLDVLGMRDELDRCFSLVQAAHEDYERWLRRDLREVAPSRTEAPPVLSFPSFDVPVFEDLAAFTGQAVLGEVSDADERVSEALLANHAVYVVNNHNLGFVGPKHCRVLVELSEDLVPDNRLVIALHKGKAYARRLVRNAANPGTVVLVSEAADPTKRPPSLLLPTEEVRILKVAGILLDGRTRYTRSSEEASCTDDVVGLGKVEIAFKVKGDSALPLARSGQTVLGGEPLSPDRFGEMEGALVAISTSDGAAFKRVGEAVRGASHVRCFEAIGGLGVSLLVRLEELDGDPFSALPLLHAARQILGVLYD